ncbi:hypothetical protein [Acidisoma sp. 7E03]
MTAQIINLAERRAAMTETAPPGRDRVMSLLLVLAEEMGLATSKYRRGGAPPQPQGRKPSTSERIQKIADNLGIDVEAPFRAKPKPASKPTQPRGQRSSKP